ncbi:Flp pilus assembly protein CpaB [Persicimonas caeni]|jgi:pilus assembly protein CpaB|uniref:Flp pilus assembly protein CpaB n=1 Tax=Persicimonas caeni TaxID=2292766 RepID=A0A4Y6PXZ6_PERCE|nr:Flp pilus assembly protein CpaB [Persicimonas caeni]QDG53186.1 Flp pilus assembly protein CpaB [Persicimonas caeni]QED34408.1 Flp pilus assembly protein CpaB [Persicimonas caeni]
MAKKKLLIAAVIVGAFAALLVYLYHTQQEKKVKNLMKNQVEVIKAARDIPAGTPLTEDKVTSEKVPQRFLPPNPVLKEDFDIYAGQPVSSSIEEGAMILTSDFNVKEVSSNLSSKIPPGERAMSIPVDNISGVSGLLRPGDRVDVLGTFPVSSEDQVIREAGGGQSVGYVTMTLLQNVTLLAVGQEISGVAAGKQQGGGRARGGYSTVTASVTIDEAELLTIAQTRGELMLLLRHNEDVEIGGVKRKTLKQVLQDLEVLNRERKKRVKTRVRKKKDDTIKIYRGTDK